MMQESAQSRSMLDQIQVQTDRVGPKETFWQPVSHSCPDLLTSVSICFLPLGPIVKPLKTPDGFAVLVRSLQCLTGLSD